MENKTKIFGCIFALAALLLSYSAMAGEGNDPCNGRDPQGGVLIPKQLVIRCNLCSDGKELELDNACIQRMTYDYKKQPDQYGEEINSIMSEYTKEDIDFAVNNLIKIGKHDDKAKNEAGYEVAPTLGGDGSTPTETLPTSDVTDCKDSQNNTRCSIEANNALTADSAQMLLEILHSKAIISREKFISNIAGYVVPNTEIDVEDKKLILPSDDMAYQGEK